MKIGIIVHSKTGNTYAVAEKLKDKLSADGHTVVLERIEPVGGENMNETNIKNIRFDQQPEVSQYDRIIFGGPVRGFSVSPVLSSYLSQITTLAKKKTSLFVTQQFPFPWMGGNHSIKQMKGLCLSKEAVIHETGIVNWSSKKREAMILDIVERLCKL
jgi:flavodoxin